MKSENMTREEMRRYGMRRSLIYFEYQYKHHENDLPNGVVVVECINELTGELNRYMCRDRQTVACIANFWFELQYKEPSTINIYMKWETHQREPYLTHTKHCERGVRCEKTWGDESAWLFLFKAQQKTEVTTERAAERV